MADVELLPLPELPVALSRFVFSSLGPLKRNAVQAELHKMLRDYARANMEPLLAENERLRAELDNKWADGMHSCHDQCQHEACVLRRRAERLAEALHKLEEACDDSDGAQYGTLGTSFVRGICKDALLREQEEGREQND